MAQRICPTKLAGASLASLVVTLSFAACTRSAPTAYVAEHRLVDRLDTSVAVEDPARPLRAQSFEIGFDQRRTLFQHPPSQVRFPGLPGGDQAQFVTALAMAPDSWSRATDGVSFEARCRTPEGEWISLLQQSLTPASEPQHRGWHEQSLSLGECSTPETEIELSTSCGPRDNCTSDWALWSDPRVLTERRLNSPSRQLALIISIDTLRPDRMGLYGSDLDTSPQLERLAADGIVFDTAVAPSPWTIPSHATLLTSSDPRYHGASDRTAIAASVAHLPELLQGAGWQTAGFVDTPYLNRRIGFHRGFDHYDDEEAPPGDYRRGAPSVRQRLLDWLGAADERPAFLFWHIMDVHGPYGAPAPFGGSFRTQLPERATPDPRLEQLNALSYHDYLKLERYRSFDDLVASYDEGLAATDSEVGRLLQTLRDAGLYDDALIIVTSDHGESFLDHDVWVGHGLFLTDDEVRVPLIVKLPGNRHAGLRVDDLVGLIDVAPTVLDSLELAAEPAFQGRSLLPLAAGEPQSARQVVHGFSSNTGAAFVRTDRLKYIAAAKLSAEQILRFHLRPREDGPQPPRLALDEQLYDLRRDPEEQAALAGDAPMDALESLRSLVAEQEEEAARRLEGLPPRAVPEPSAEDLERLRSLGYVDG